MVAFLAAIGLTACPSLGKDDFYGYWRTTDFDEDGNRLDYYLIDTDKYQIEWDFDGVSENMFKDGGTFKQHLIRKNDSGTTVNETFWTGKYELKGNSGYSYGQLVLYYEYGVQFTNTTGAPAITGKSYNDVKNWKEADFLNWWKYGTLSPSQETTGTALLTDSDLINAPTTITNPLSDGSSGIKNNGITVQKRKNGGNTEYGDIEIFRYRLEDGIAFKGYGRMLTTTVNKDGSKSIGGVYNQWAQKTGLSVSTFDPKLGKKSTKYGWKNNSECSWNGTNFRALGLVNKEDNQWASNDNRSNEELFKITSWDGSKIAEIETTNDPTDYDELTDDIEN